jgi:CRP-like cAMP-binding protein
MPARSAPLGHTKRQSCQGGYVSLNLNVRLVGTIALLRRQSDQHVPRTLMHQLAVLTRGLARARARVCCYEFPMQDNNVEIM